jgi:hypothetical protein
LELEERRPRDEVPVADRSEQRDAPLGGDEAGADAGGDDRRGQVDQFVYRSKTRFRLCGLRVFVDQAVEDLSAADPGGGEVSNGSGCRWT